jgi:predicted extracellular nuclease
MVHGVVTLLAPGQGFYLEQATSGESGRGSRALYVADSDLSGALRPGQRLALRGRITEAGPDSDPVTSLTDLDQHVVCNEEWPLPLTPVRLPIDARQREDLESMRITFEQPLWVVDAYGHAQGQLTVGANPLVPAPTEVADPGPEATRQQSRNRQSLLRASLPGRSETPLRAGSRIEGVAGVLGHDGKNQRFLLHAVRPYPALADPPPPRAGQLRLVSLNLFNFFNGDGLGGGFPAPRGARSLAAFERQKDRLQASLSLLRPDLFAVQELENDGFGPHSAAGDLRDLLQTTVPGDWAAAKPDRSPVGNDEITVGLFYRADRLEAVGPARVLSDPVFQSVQRPPLAQLLRHRATGQAFLVATAHFKSKGGCPRSGKNADRGDGQGCWNPARTAAAGAMTRWLEDIAREAAARQILVLGDLNALRREDPIHHFRAAGYVELVEEFSAPPHYSYIYRGEAGTLDYALATPDLLAATVQARIWHANAAWPSGMKLPEPWLRVSDHDPVVVDLDFSQASASD